MWDKKDYRYGFKCESIRKDAVSVDLAKRYYLSDDLGREALRITHPDHCDTTFADVDTYEFILEENPKLSTRRDELRFEKTQTGRPVDGLRAVEESLRINNETLEQLRRQYGLLQKPKPKTLLSREDMPWCNH